MTERIWRKFPNEILNFFGKRRRKIEEKHVKGNGVEEGLERVVESEGREGWRGYYLTVIAPNCINIKDVIFWGSS